MAEEGTAVLEQPTEPVVADTPEPAAPAEDTQPVSETEPGDDSEDAETENFTAEQVAEREREAEERATQRLREELAEEARVEAERQTQASHNAALERAGGEFAVDALRRSAYWALDFAEKHPERSKEEIAQMVDARSARGFVELWRNEIGARETGVALRKSFDIWGDALLDRVNAKFPDWRAPKDVEANFRKAVASGDGNKAVDGLFAYLMQAIEEAEVPKRLKAVRETEQKQKLSAQEVAKLQKGSDGTGPAKVGGSGPAASDPDSVMARVHPLSKEYAAAFKTKYGFDPPSP